MRIAVLGAYGSIGHALVRRAPLHGHTARAVVRDPAKGLEVPPGTEVVGADLLDGEALIRACEGCDAIIHAGNVPYPEWAERVPAMARNALHAAEANGAVLGFPGNVYVYGRPRARPLAEDHPLAPHTVKGKIRLEVERELLRAHSSGKARVVIPRFPDFYGPGSGKEIVDGTSLRALRPVFDSAISGKPCRWPLTASVLREYIYIDDAADAMLTLLEAGGASGRAIHVPGPGAISGQEFIETVCRLAGHRPRIQTYGRGMLLLVGLVNREARAAYEMAYLFDDPVILDGTLYRTVTGSAHPATPYEEGIRRTLEWYRGDGRGP